ncbi:hypothetical protein ACLB2K_050745 [Fragaria x ananassa]
MDAFYEFVNDSLSVSVRKSQMQEKVKRMKKKYNNMAKMKTSMPKKGYELEGGKAKSLAYRQASKEAFASVALLYERVGFDNALKELGFWESFVKQCLGLTDKSNRAELNDRWVRLHVVGLEIFLEKDELMRDQAMLI